jgi:hypothetical protein|uniref:Uncharacterized protein n=1 Tax=Siphoviridae sp. ctMOb8 TaxID=2825460 RepID=A0A8S5Q077_9CAUD|nr:MAG TPA: hypothetical protein [Siphoviridae sp. ctMOb8]
MTKEIVEKIANSYTPLQVDDLSVEDKKALYVVLAKKGFTLATFYLRFFQKGFSKWEIEGINECKRQFLLLPDVSQLLLDYVGEDDPQMVNGDKGYLYTLAQSDEPGLFYSCLKRANAGMCNKFIAYMNERGMSAATVIKRFTVENWKPWEQEGIRSILASYTTNE